MEIRKYRRSNQEISAANKRRKWKDRQCNVQQFRDVKGEIDHGKANRVHTIQWPKKKKQTMIFRALRTNINIEQQENRR